MCPAEESIYSLADGTHDANHTNKKLKTNMNEIYQVTAVIAKTDGGSRRGTVGGQVVEQFPWTDFRDTPVYISIDQMKELHPMCEIKVNFKNRK